MAFTSAPLAKTNSTNKIAKKLVIKSFENKLTENYIVDNTLDPELSASDLKRAIQDYLRNFDDNTDVIDEDNKTISIRSVD